MIINPKQEFLLLTLIRNEFSQIRLLMPDKISSKRLQRLMRSIVEGSTGSWASEMLVESVIQESNQGFM